MTTSKKNAEQASISISVEPPKPLTVELVGEVYQVRPIKGALGVALGSKMQEAGEDPAKLVQVLEDLVLTIFGKEQKPKIMARLEDSEDLLDYPQIMELLNAIVERSSGNPTM